MKTILSLVLATCVLMPALSGQMVKVKGKGEVVYTGFFRQGSADERRAITEAKVNAVQRFAADFEPARYELYKKSEKEIIARIDEFVGDFTQVDQQVDKTSKRYTVVIEASVNASLIEQTLQADSSAQAADQSEKSNIVFIFVARELASRKIFEAKRTVMDSNEKSGAASEHTDASDNSSAAQSSSESSTLTKKTTGGSTELKADAITYQVSTVAEVDGAVNSVLTKAGYETVDPTDAGLDVAKFKADFSSGNDIAAPTRSEAIGILRQNDVRYMAIANMDVGLAENDEVSGLIRVYVTVTAKITYLPPASAGKGPKKLPKTVASIAGKPYAGLGSNPQVARTNALNEAALKSAGELMDQLRLKNIK